MSETRVQQQPLIHPSTIVMTLVLASITALFIGLTGAYIYSRVQTGIEAPYPPVMFYVTIVLLVAANRFISSAKDDMYADNMEKVENKLRIGLAITVVFAITQIVGWIQFFTGPNAIQESNTLAYLFVISVLHHAHVIVGIPFLLVFVIKLHKTPVVDLQLSDRNKRYVKSLSRYWNYIDVLWILLVAMLLASAFIS